MSTDGGSMSVQSAGQQGVLLLTRCSPAVTAVASCRFRPLRRRFSAWRGVHVSQEEDSWLAYWATSCMLGSEA
jgi:hypothetical protein